MSQPHKNALNKYLTTLNNNQIMYANETFSGYTSNQVYKQKDGSVLLKNPRYLQAGLFGKGGQDSIGMELTLITEKHLGTVIPWFKVMELKLPGDTVKPDQKQWYKIMKSFGAITEILLYDDGVFKPLDIKI